MPKALTRAAQGASPTRANIDQILMPKLPDLMDNEAKRTRIRNLLNRMSTQDHTIVNVGSRAQPRWVLATSEAAKLAKVAKKKQDKAQDEQL